MRIKSIYIEPRTEHSKKPEYIRNMISKWYPDKTKLEMFARPNIGRDLFGKSSMDGWDVWGNEVESDIKLAP